MVLPTGRFSRQAEKGSGFQVSDMVQRAPEGNGASLWPPAQGGLGGSLRRGLLGFARQREATVLVVVVVLFIFFALERTAFLSKANQVTLFSDYAAQYIIIALGEVLLLICGEIDLSVGFVLTFSPFLMYYLIAFYHVPGLLAIVIALLMGVAVGWVNAFFTITVGLPSFITTLGTGFILLGITDTTSHDEPATIPADVVGIGKWIATYAWAQIVWAVVLVVIFHILLTRTRWGLHTIAAGGNLLGAREAGIHVNRVKYGNFMLTGLLGAFVGLQIMYYTNNIDPNSGGYQPMFYAVTAAVIGGTAMLGGSGTIIGGALGGVVLAILIDGFAVMGFSANPVSIIFGSAILVAMVANVSLTRVRERGQG
jgi:simple sugar transport system permease protein